MAVDGRADLRGQAERGIAELATLVSRAHTQLKDPRLSGRELKAPRATVAAAEVMLQEARAALKNEDYPGVTKALNGAAAELQAALAQIDDAASPRSSGRRR
jgi:hypothetical protein